MFLLFFFFSGSSISCHLKLLNFYLQIFRGKILRSIRSWRNYWLTILSSYFSSIANTWKVGVLTKNFKLQSLLDQVTEAFQKKLKASCKEADNYSWMKKEVFNSYWHYNQFFILIRKVSLSSNLWNVKCSSFLKV